MPKAAAFINAGMWPAWNHGTNYGSTAETRVGNGSIHGARGGSDPHAGTQYDVLAEDSSASRSVYAPDNGKIGKISDLILSKDAKTVEGLVIGVGGILVLAQKPVGTEARLLRFRYSAFADDERRPVGWVRSAGGAAVEQQR